MSAEVFFPILIVVVGALIALLLWGREPKVERQAEAPGSMFAKAHYELVVDAPGKWSWRLRAANGEIVAHSEQSFSSRAAAERAVAAVRRTAATTLVEGST